MKSEKGQGNKAKRNLKFHSGCIVVLIIIGYPIYFLIKSGIRAFKLSTESKTTTAIVIRDGHYAGNTLEDVFFHSYEFTIGGEKYTGNTRSSEYKVGDTVEINYAESNPNFNELKKDDKE